MIALIMKKSLPKQGSLPQTWASAQWPKVPVDERREGFGVGPQWDRRVNRR